jgi:hypothetical protein
MDIRSLRFTAITRSSSACRRNQRLLRPFRLSLRTRVVVEAAVLLGEPAVLQHSALR